MRYIKSLTIALLSITIITFVFGLVFIAEAGPELSPEKDGKIDLGISTEGELIKGSFIITNTGDSTLTINHYMATCSCLEITKSISRDLPPGASGKFRFVFDTAGLDGNKAKKDVILFSNARDDSQRITILTQVREPGEYHAASEEVRDGFTVLVDLRSPDNFAREHILGAINVPEEDFEAWAKTLPEGITVYIYSEEGDVSDRLAKDLDPKLSIKLRSMVGGFLKWKLRHESFLVGKE